MYDAKQDLLRIKKSLENLDYSDPVARKRGRAWLDEFYRIMFAYRDEFTRIENGTFSRMYHDEYARYRARK